jgi:type IV secretion system protein VirB11
MNPLLHDTLRRLAIHYAGEDVEEIAMNRPGEVWVKRSGGAWEANKDPALSEDYVLILCHQLANVSGQTFHKVRMPVLYATLPEGHRFTAVVGAGVRHDIGDTHGIAVTVRIFDPARQIALERYGLSTNAELSATPHRPGRQRYAESPLEDLLAAVRNREALLISGATSSGKTSFLNAIIGYLPAESRVVTVEDAREVIIPHPNRVHLVVSRTEAAGCLDFARVVDAVVRMTPDVIICGEIGITNAAGVFRLMTTAFRI